MSDDFYERARRDMYAAFGVPPEILGVDRAAGPDRSVQSLVIFNGEGDRLYCGPFTMEKRGDGTTALVINTGLSGAALAEFADMLRRSNPEMRLEIREQNKP